MAKHKGEAWRPVVGYEGLYEVSLIGRVRSNIPSTRIADKLHKIMRQKVDDHGYLRVNLTKNKTAKAWLVSRLVAEAFIPNPNGYPMVGHNDDVKTNNGYIRIGEISQNANKKINEFLDSDTDLYMYIDYED